MNKIILAGGSGFLGRTLTKWQAAKGMEVVVLSRRAVPIPGARLVGWDGKSLGAWQQELENATALVNLAGRSVNCRYHAQNRRQMMDSRIDSTRVLGKAIQACSHPPPVWLNSSTATIYRHTYGEPHSESGTIAATPEAKDAFSIEIAENWEQEFNQAKTPNTRKVTLRAAMVMGKEPGGVYEVLRRLTRFGLGGKMAHGKQYVSWLHETDFCQILDWLIEHDHASGIYNLCAPNPLPNAEMMRTLRKVLGVPIGLPATQWMLEIGAFVMRTETELIIKSRRVIPQRLLDEGYQFAHPTFEAAVRALESSSYRAQGV